MSFGCVSYRNGKYQGKLKGSQRHGVGVVIDDDLTFHVSHWLENRMQGPTLVYLAHAKYIYGEWKNNQPHGLNVYRSGDTVLLARYVFGVPSQRCLLIFERHGFGCVLQENSQQWTVVKAGPLGSHSALMKLIQLLQVEVPEHYLSLTKFACHLSTPQSSLRTFPCHHSHCYFGFLNGLAIVFNSNNGLVTVGHHRNEQLCEFGGKFSSNKAAEEGNFSSPNETVQYCGEKPLQRIHAIYQKLHKRDPNFINEAFESKIKVFTSIQSLIISKLKQIVQDTRREGIGRFDLNQSLDYHEHDGQESIRLDQLRDKMYSPPKKTFSRSSTYTPQKAPSHQPQSLLKKEVKKLIDASTGKAKEREEKSCTPSRQRRHRLSEFTEEAQNNYLFQKGNASYGNPFSKKIEEAKPQEFMIGISYQQSNILQETSSFKRLIEDQETEERAAISTPARKASNCIEQQLKEQDLTPKSSKPGYKRREKSIEQFARPTYQDIQERRKRILREFQALNGGQVVTPQRQKEKQKDKEKDKIMVIDSPCKQHLLSVDRDDQSSFGYIPLSISNRISQKRQAAKPAHQESTQLDQRSRSSTRRAHYNYAAIDSRATPNENKEPPSVSQAVPMLPQPPAGGRQKRTYQYMYE